MAQHDLDARIEAAARYNRDLDARLRGTGVVDRELFAEFAAVEADPNASSVAWLQAKLRVLATRVSNGESVCVCDPPYGLSALIETASDLIEWADRHFPVAGFNG